MGRFLVNENYIMWGFRYALGRRTGAVTDVVETLKRVWHDLALQTRMQIQAEIKEAIERDRAGANCDIVQWQEILNIKE